MKRPKPLEPRFIVDECMGSSVVDAIVEAGGRAVLLTDHVKPGTEDVDFIPRLCDWGEAFVTRDLAMRTNEGEKQALGQCKIHVFIFRAGGAKLDELQQLVKDRHPSMRNYVHKYGIPFLARVTNTGIDVLTKTGRRGGMKK